MRLRGPCSSTVGPPGEISRVSKDGAPEGPDSMRRPTFEHRLREYASPPSPKFACNALTGR